MSNIISLMVAFFTCFFIICLCEPVAVKMGLVDTPNNRKKHEGQVPLVGGVAIYIGVLISSLMLLDYTHTFQVYIFTSSIVLMVGVLDDRFSLSVKLRVVVQILLALIMFYWADVSLKSLGNILGFFEVELNSFSVFLTIIAVIGGINAFNMVDGIDGLAGVLSMISFVALAILLGTAGSTWYLLCLLFISAITAFLLFNLRWPSKQMNKVFMGDAGSMLIGFTVVWLLLIGADEKVTAFKPVTALYLIAIPLMDMAAIMYRRVRKGKSPFEPDRDHLHHIFERAGCTRKHSLVIISLMSITCALLGSVLDYLGVPEWILLTIFILIFILYCYALSRIWRILSWVRKH